MVIYNIYQTWYNNNVLNIGELKKELMNIFEYIESDNNYKYYSNKFPKSNGYFNEGGNSGNQAVGYNLLLKSSTELQTRLSAEYRLYNFMQFKVTAKSQLARVEFIYKKTSKEFQINIYNDSLFKDGTSIWYDFVPFVLSFLSNQDSKGIDVKYLFKDYKNQVSNYNSNYYFVVEGIELSTDQFKQIVNYMVFKSYMKMRRIELRSSEDRFIGSSDFDKSIWDI